MPWDIKRMEQCPASKPFAVVKRVDGSIEGCHPSREDALRQLAALNANVEKSRICKIDEDQRLVFGWASVVEDKDGTSIVDSDGEVIELGDLERAAYDYVLKARMMGEMHEGDAIGQLVESFVLTPEKAAAMGIDAPHSGWWFGAYVDDPVAFQRVKSGEYQMFSIQGLATAEEIT